MTQELQKTPDEAQERVAVSSTRLLGGWVDAKEKLPPYLTPVLLLDVNRYMAFDPYGNWKGVGVLAGEEMWQPYWSVIGESGGLILDAQGLRFGELARKSDGVGSEERVAIAGFAPGLAHR